jgi:tetratricopeptide (TPR) repeat protein
LFRFWGVFWIDASTTERIKQSLATISKIAKVEPNENAALYWLSNIKQRWLLLIDNADDRSIPLEKYFPKGNRGHILVTTRVPAHKVHGNVGPSFYDFEKLDANDANQLLLRAANKSMSGNLTSVSNITVALDFLALAIIHAGAAIRKGLCTLETYLVPFYENSWKSISRRKYDDDEDESPIKKVYASWEANYTDLESKATGTRADAIELLKTFAFFHRENIPFEVLKRAVLNGATEEELERENKKKSADPAERKLIYYIRNLKYLWNHGFITSSPPVFPKSIRKCLGMRSDKSYETALRRALGELTESSLISYNENNDSWSMHPLQHRYARERLSVAEQGLWAEAAASVLAASILLPPLGVGVEHQDFNRYILPHVDHILRCRNDVENTTAENRSVVGRRWMFPAPIFTRQRASMYAKFSLVYAQCGRWSDAEALLSEVKTFLYTNAGPEDAKSRRVTMFLSDILWNLGRLEEAYNMQQAVLELCQQVYGQDHLEVLRVKDKLGQTLSRQGRVTQARSVQEEVVIGLVKKLGPKHEETLKAKDNLGNTVKKSYAPEDLDRAYHLHKEAVEGMLDLHGSDHIDTLMAQENLAMVMYDLGDHHIEEAETLIQEVFEKRKSIMGKEHPYTLLAMICSSIIKIRRGASQEAENLLRSGLEIANRNLEKDHVGTLFGRMILGSALIQQKRYSEAEEILRDTSERQKHMPSRRGIYHPDRVGALVELAKCYRLQGKLNLSLQTCDEAVDGFESITPSKQEHTLARALKQERLRLVRHQEAVAAGQEESDSITEPLEGPYRLYHLF